MSEEVRGKEGLFDGVRGYSVRPHPEGWALYSGLKLKGAEMRYYEVGSYATRAQALREYARRIIDMAEIIGTEWTDAVREGGK